MRRRIKIPDSKSKPRLGPSITVYSRDGEEEHVIYAQDGTPQLYGDEQYCMSIFSARHGLSPAQVRVADALWRKAQRLRPIDTSTHRGRLKLRLRMSGIVSCVKQGLVGNSQWGLSMHRHRGGKAMEQHNLATLWANGEKTSRRYAIRRQLGMKGH